MRSLSGVLLCCALACDGSDQGPAAATTSSAPALPVTPRAVDPSALEEIVRAAPSAPRPTASSGTLVGSDTGLDASARPVTSASAGPRVRSSAMRFQRPISSPAIEQAMRRSVYWRLSRACRAGGELPPPDVVRFELDLRADGTIEPGSVRAKADDPKYAAVAECVARELAASDFRGPAAGRETDVRIVGTWPSVD